MKKIFMDSIGLILNEAFYNIFKFKYETHCQDLSANEPWISTPWRANLYDLDKIFSIGFTSTASLSLLS
jgi:hypothetical protein